MMPDYSSWKLTLEGLVTDFEHENLEGSKGGIIEGYSRWTKYDDGNWYYVTVGGEKFREITRSFLCEGCDVDLYNAQPEAFRKYVWGSDILPYTTMPPNVPVLMPPAAVAKKIAAEPPADDQGLPTFGPYPHLVDMSPELTTGGSGSQDTRPSGVGTTVIVGGALLGTGYAIWRYWPQISRWFK